jgi:serine/threonine protein kinase
MAQRSKNYEIICKIGQGSFGKVYKVRRKTDNLILVIKMIKIQSLSKKNQQDSLHEVTILSSLNCPYIVKYYESFVENLVLHIVMEYCEKGDLSQVVKKQQLTHQKIWKYFIQACIGVEYLHSRQILHRDIKSLNLFLSNDDNIRIGDLGVAKMLSNTAAFAQTQVGSPYYLSPELCEEKPYNTKSDVWALGCVLYEICTARHPFNAPNQAALLLKIVKGSYTPLPSEFPESLKEIVDMCLEKDYKKRPNISFILQRQDIQAIADNLHLLVPSTSALNRKTILSVPGPSSRPEVIRKAFTDTSYQPTKAFQDPQKLDLDNNIEKKIIRPFSANKSDQYVPNRILKSNQMDEPISKRADSPGRIKINVTKKLEPNLIQNNLNKDYSDKLKEDFSNQKLIPAKEIYKHRKSVNDSNAHPIKSSSPLKKVLNSGNELEIIQKTPSKVLVPEKNPSVNERKKLDAGALKLHFRPKNLFEANPEIKQPYKPRIPASAKGPNLDFYDEEVKLVENLPEIPKIKKKLTVKCLNESSPVRQFFISQPSQSFKVLKKPEVQPIIFYSTPASKKISAIKNPIQSTLPEDILLDTKFLDHSMSLQTKEIESYKRGEELRKKCSDLRSSIIQMIGSNVFNEMHNIFTEIINVKNS